MQENTWHLKLKIFIFKCLKRTSVQGGHRGSLSGPGNPGNFLLWGFTNLQRNKTGGVHKKQDILLNLVFVDILWLQWSSYCDPPQSVFQQFDICFWNISEIYYLTLLAAGFNLMFIGEYEYVHRVPKPSILRKNVFAHLGLMQVFNQRSKLMEMILIAFSMFLTTIPISKISQAQIQILSVLPFVRSRVTFCVNDIFPPVGAPLTACVHARVRFIRVKGSNKTTVSPYSQCVGKHSSHTLMLCSARYLPEGTPFSPGACARSGSGDIDLTLTVPCIYWAPLSLWCVALAVTPDNMWIKLSLTHPLREGIQVQARHATLLPGPLSMMKLILENRTWPRSPLSRPSVWEWGRRADGASRKEMGVRTGIGKGEIEEDENSLKSGFGLERVKETSGCESIHGRSGESRRSDLDSLICL